MRIVNRLLAWTGWVLVPRHSVKMLIEYGNVVEAGRGSSGGLLWLRRVARLMPLTGTDRESRTVALFLREGR